MPRHYPVLTNRTSQPATFAPPSGAQDEQALFARVLAFLQSRRVAVASLLTRSLSVTGDALVTGILTARQVKATTASVASLTGAARGTLGYVQVAVNSVGYGAASLDVPSLTLTVTFLPGRRYRITGSLLMSSTLACVAQAILVEDVTAVQTANFDIATNGSNTSIPITFVTAPHVGTASHTFKIQANVSAGAGTNNAAAAFPSYLLIEDIGP